MFRRLGDETSEGYMLGNLSLVLMDAGDLDRAEALSLQALDHWERLDDQESRSYSLSTLGELALMRGEIDRSISFHRESMHLRSMLGIQTGIAKQLECFAEIAFEQSQDERSATLYGAAARVRMEIGNPNEPRFEAKFSKIAEIMRNRIGSARFSEAWERGVAMTTEESVAEALKT
jgi:hypothetical protein